MTLVVITPYQPRMQTCFIVDNKHKRTYLKQCINVPTKNGTLTLHPTIDKIQPLLLVAVTPEPNSKAWGGVLLEGSLYWLHNWTRTQPGHLAFIPKESHFFFFYFCYAYAQPITIEPLSLCMALFIVQQHNLSCYFSAFSSIVLKMPLSLPHLQLLHTRGSYPSTYVTFVFSPRSPIREHVSWFPWPPPFLGQLLSFPRCHNSPSSWKTQTMLP